CDTPEESAGGVKFHQRVFAAMEHVDVALGIHRNTGRLDEVLARRQLEESRDWRVLELRDRRFRRGLRRRGLGPDPEPDAAESDTPTCDHAPSPRPCRIVAVSTTVANSPCRSASATLCSSSAPYRVPSGPTLSN